MWKLGDKQSGRCTQRPYCWMLPLTVYRLTVNGGTVKQVLFCGFQRQRKPTLAERKICVFCGFCVNIIPTLALRLLFPHTEYTEYTEIIQ